MRNLIILTFLTLTSSVLISAQANPDSVCPSVSVDGPSRMQAGVPATFTLTISDEAKNYDLKYKWTVTGGKIVGGQGTISIQAVRTDEMGSVTASVAIFGLPQGCPVSVSSTDGSDGPVTSKLLADYSPAEGELDIMKAGSIGSESQDEPNSQLFILVTLVNGTPKTQIRDTVDRLLDLLTGAQQIVRDRITILTGFSSKNRVKIYLVPPGAENPSCEKCEEFKDVVSSSCPSITVDGPAGITLPGKPEVFTAMISDDVKAYQPKYRWSVEGGRIVGGQGTLSIKVLRRADVVNLVATIEILGLPQACVNSASASSPFVLEFRSLLIDEYGSILLSEEYARLRAANVELKRHKDSMLYLVKYPPKSIVPFEKRNHSLKTFVAKVLSIGSRFRMVIGPYIGDEHTKIFIVPPGADNPQP